ncbi:unnamed protein product (macronuclear) [Paramecium tetraurelia]|uniref:Transmembrane protein n=1 Tax=Paramecium tetraurelia TaxID=5888 RepID=A0DMU4_PARTE|nr:uncharacterized protein GSPATT00018565001 [Paramecium tetraurelia]CAK84361.1 unnamed protein product [Paramecium tetraurelia]|eukprot:XP_001451758.1 hypothetical protein (macronuclear) [Paramecium tetraurelia strain d4-2]
MLKHFVNHIRKIDQFGVVYQPKIKYSTNEYKTAVGGIMSIILYGLSFGYLLYSFIQYGQGNILPKITTIQVKTDQQSIFLENEIMSFKIRPGQDNFINPFNPSALVLLPLVLPFKNNEIPPSQYFNFEQIQFSEEKISIRNLDLQYGDPSQEETEQIIAFVGCKQVNLPSPFACANQSIQDQFFAQSRNAMIATTQVNQFNTDRRTLDEVGKEQVLAIVNNSTYFQTINLNIQESQVDTGFLLEQIESYVYATDYYLTNQQMGQEYFRTTFKFDAYMVFQLRISKLRYLQSIQYPKISEILADAGSIGSTILLLSYFVILCNQSLMEKQSLDDIISIYYPQYKDLQIKQTFYGSIKEVIFEGKQQDLEQFKQYQKELQERAEKKLSMLNLVYEISRLQFMITNILKSKEQLRQSHKIGIKLKQFEMQKLLNDENLNGNQIIPHSNLNCSSSKLAIIDSQSDSSQNLKKPQQQQQITVEESSDENQLNDEDFEILIQPSELEE